MHPSVNDNSTGGIDNGLLTEIVHEFNLARRNVLSYPKGHPVVSRTCERVAGLFDRLFTGRGEITFGVAKETLLFGADSLDRFTPAVKGVAGMLFHHGIALVTFMKGLSPGEIEAFSGILGLKRTGIAAAGGIEQLMREAGIEHLRVRKICYDAFRASDELSECGQLEILTPWEGFVRRLSAATLEPPPDGDFPAGPSELAGLVNDRYSITPGLMTTCLEAAIQESSGQEILSGTELEYLRKLGKFVEGLSGEPRRRFLEGLFGFSDEREGRALKILAHLPAGVYPEIREYAERDQVTLTPLALEVIERMMRLSRPDPTVPDGSGGGTPDPDGEDRKMEVLFREELDNEFTPRDYLETLRELVHSGSLTGQDLQELEGLKGTLASERIESSVGAIILASIGLASPERMETLKNSLVELSRYFLETGNFRALGDMYARLRAVSADSGGGAGELKDEVLRLIGSDDFVAEVLNGLDVWGKDKYLDIGTLIQRVGAPSVEPLLDRLAGEQNRTLRRWCLDQILKMGGRAKDAVLARLGDKRWYVVRNLVIILRHTGDPGVLVHLAGLARFPHPKVRHLVLETYLSFHDPEGDRLLLRELAGDDGEARLRAIQYAGNSRDPLVHGALLKILGQKGLSSEQFEEKKAALHALAKAGCRDSLPVLEKMLSTRHFLRRSLWNLLKREMVLSLGGYRDSSARALLLKIAHSSSRRLSGVAAEVMAAMEGSNGR